MKTFYNSIILLCASITFAQTPCENGFADEFPCLDYDLMAHIDLNELSAGSGNDSWGWTDPQDNSEYAIVGLNNGTAFIDISEPTNPIYLGKLPTHTTNSQWRDIKVYGNYAFIVSEANGHGMQVFDLTKLRNVPNAPLTFDADAHYDGFGNAHNIIINPSEPFAYAVGTSTYSGGPHFVDISDPLNPVEAGGYDSSFYTHDAQVVTYNGPDEDYIGQEIFLGSNEDEVVFVDVSNKFNPTLISSIDYSNIGYTHQAWLTEDQRYFILGDEIDEINFGFNTRTLIFDLQDLDNPLLHHEYLGPTSAIDHNGYVDGNTYYLSNYSAGLRLINVENIGDAEMTEIGFFDTYPENDSPSFSGLWSNYPYFESGNIVLSDIDRGFFLIRKSGTVGTQEFATEHFKMYPNPATNVVEFEHKNNLLNSIEIFNLIGQKVKSFQFEGENSVQINIENLKSGMYLVKINGKHNEKLIVK
ncbi:choice-of-anchor B family protein [Psychroflexus aestuariivivens]|uniref:choice-of-anchor B family protein n=1 Tax=Psychroflexus aestuariivivens TaxID=1795040 RepID=UPI000FD9BDB1|nr:choice-of-anchor B family protein [Psychroflexus aestuariivivens]